jgi:hypothetical protein
MLNFVNVCKDHQHVGIRVTGKTLYTALTLVMFF